MFHIDNELDIWYNYTVDGIHGLSVTKDGKTTEYVFRRNFQGDVTHIYKQQYNMLSLAARYKYDAWGKCEVEEIDGSGIGAINPIRYRSYYFDTETGLYYLNARYYDPETGRFISADDTKFLNPDAINGLNLFAYCGNNPVMNVDPSGRSFFATLLIGIIVGATIGFLSGGIKAVQNGQSFWNGALLGAFGGAVLGAALGFGAALAIGGASIAVGLIGLGVTGAVSFGAGIGIYALETHLYGTEFNWKDAMLSGLSLSLRAMANYGMGFLLGKKGYFDYADKFSVKNPIKTVKLWIKSSWRQILERTYLKMGILSPITWIIDKIFKEAVANN